jgi:5'-nucleotidase
LAAAVLGGAGCAHGPPAGQAVAARPPARVRLLTVNDFHGQLPAGKKQFGRPAGSAGVLMAWLLAARAGAEERTVLVSAGDLVGASPPASALLQDEPSVSLLNRFANEACHAIAVGAKRGTPVPPEVDARFAPWLDPACNVVATVGNHEFDEGRAELLRLLLGGNHPRGPFLDKPWAGARYPTLAANVVDHATGRPILPPYVVKEVGGVKVGFVGVLVKDVPHLVSPAGVAGLDFLDEADTVNHYVPVLRAQGVRAVVVVAHQGGEQPPYLGETRPGGAVEGDILDLVSRLDPEVDVVVAAHTHAFLNARLPAQGGKPVLVVEAWSAGTAFGWVDLEIDRESGDVVASSAAVQVAYADEGPGRTPDRLAAALQSAAEARVAPLTQRMVATSAREVGRRQTDAGESPLGDLVADAQRAAFQDADVALMNPGGIRAELPAGAINWGQVFAAQPFGNELVAMTLTGAQLRAVLEGQWSEQDGPRILQVSGLSYSWSESARSGAKVRAVVVGGVPLDPARRYRVVVNAFLAGGGDGFGRFGEGTDRIVGPNDLDALVTYLQNLPQPFEAPGAVRIRVEP